MTVNITQNALSSKPGGSISRATNIKEYQNKAPEQQALNQLSTGISLSESGVSRQPQTPENNVKEDSSEVSSKAATLNNSSTTNFAQITAMQEEIGKLDNLQTALESVSTNVWGIEEQVAKSQAPAQENPQPAPEPNLEAEAVDVSIDTTVFETERAEMQQIVDKHLEGIDHTGSELLDYFADFKAKYMSETDISSESLGKSSEMSSNSLASLKSGGNVAISDSDAKEIVAKAQEQVASLQVSTEMHRGNILNDVGKAIATATSEMESPETNQSIESSVQEISNILRSNPNALPNASQVDPTQVTGLLL